MIWPGAEHLNQFLSQSSDLFKGCSVLELGSGVGKLILYSWQLDKTNEP